MRSCAITGKKTHVGKAGIHRHSGAWRLRAPHTQRLWHPNLHSVKVDIEGTPKRIKVTTKALRMIKAAGNKLTKAEAKAFGII
jgi:ribosomal protein L28